MSDAESIEIRERGPALLHNPKYNKGTAFTLDERVDFELEGLLPDIVSSLELQAQRSYRAITRKQDPLEQYIGLVALQDRNETLFYRLVLDNIEEFLPIVYTPTVGLATQKYSHIFRRARGIWITPAHRGRIRDVLLNAPCEEVRLIVVTDSERILGLGDQGAGGMAIPIGKLALYTVGAGIHPSHTQPICIDVGTDNEDLLNDELYIGWRERRLRGEAYDELIEEFVRAVMSLYPKALLQWEDFKKVNAMRLLERYREKLLSFNDDIQGTAAVGLAGVLAGVRATGVSFADHRVVILGAGAAGIGIADQVRTAFRRAGVDESDLMSRIAVLDSRGLLRQGRTYREGEDYKERYSWSEELLAHHRLGDSEPDLEAVVRAIHPTVLIGTSGQPGTFSENVVREMASKTERPLIFPFSNPTSKSEAVPEDLIAWTGGRALVATGSPFRPVEFEDRRIRIGQGNNVFIFPGVGLGTLVAEARQVTDEMFTVAAEILAEQVTLEELEQGQLYPQLTRLRSVSSAIANGVAEEAMRSGHAPKVDESELESRIEAAIWTPVYPKLIPA